MKKTTRLTALLLALVLLLGTLSASATETTGGISLYNLTGEMYEELLAEAVSVGLTANQPCGTNNPYCASVTLIGAMATAQERYDYLTGLSGTAAQNVLMHYYEKHTAEETLCLCAYPAFDAEYVPGGINHDEDCPWHFANLSVSEQYAWLSRIDKTQQETYINSIQDEAKLELLKAYLDYAEGTYTAPCNPDSCEYVAKYNVDFFSMNTFALYEYLLNLYNTTKDAEGYPSVEYNDLMSHLRDAHIAEEKFCQCWSFDISNPKHSFGTLFHSESTVGGTTIECPWHFAKLTTAEQAQIYNGLSSEDKSEYYALLSDKQKAELNAFLAGVGETDKTITTNKDSGEGSTEPEVQVNISVPAGVFGADVKHVMEAGEALMTTEKAEALNAVSTGHTLAAFDISFYNLDRPGEKLQPEPGRTVPLTFTVDVSNVDGDTMQVYHVYEENGQYKAEAVGEPIAVNKSEGTQTIEINAESFSTYILEGLCSGDTENCSYNEFAKKSGFERAALLAEWLEIPVENQYYSEIGFTKYDDFLGHLETYHRDSKAVCLCLGAGIGFKENQVDYDYGTTAHGLNVTDFNFKQVACPWHFSQILIEEQYEVVKDMTTEEREQYMTEAGLSEEQKAALNEYIEYIEAPCEVVDNQLVCNGVALANITEHGYIIDIATGIAVGRYDFDTQTFIMGTGN